MSRSRSPRRKPQRQTHAEFWASWHDQQQPNEPLTDDDTGAPWDDPEIIHGWGGYSDRSNVQQTAQLAVRDWDRPRSPAPAPAPVPAPAPAPAPAVTTGHVILATIEMNIEDISIVIKNLTTLVEVLEYTRSLFRQRLEANAR
jgi:hypothetical protein